MRGTEKETNQTTTNYTNYSFTCKAMLLKSKSLTDECKRPHLEMLDLPGKGEWEKDPWGTLWAC